MLWLAVHLPHLSLEAFCATLAPERRAGPVALVAEHRISAINAEAAARGIQVGSKRATALALAADVLLGQADAPRDAAALLGIAHAALVFTPSVCLQGPAIGNAGADTVLLEVQPSLRCFGGPRALLRQLRTALAPFGHDFSIASAPTALGAALLARSALPARQRHASNLEQLHKQLNSLPVWLLGPARAHWEALQGMGLHTLADLRALPRSGLARRFGPLLLTELDRAWGRVPDVREWLSLPASFSSRLELHSRADTTQQVLAGAMVLLARLVAWAQARCARVAAFTLRMRHEARHRGLLAASSTANDASSTLLRSSDSASHAAATELRIELADPSIDAAHLQLLLRERLARCTLAAPTLELQIDCHELREGAPPSGELFPSPQGEAQGLARLLERLRARLGDEQVQWLHAHPDHRPEHATRLAAAPPRALPALSAAACQALHGGHALPLQRPLWLLHEPQALAERDTWPLLEGHALQLLAGPERIETGWWDGAPATRDYFIAQSHDGSLVWIYRQRLPPRTAQEAASSWVLQGRFA